MSDPQWLPAWTRDEGAERARLLFGRTFADDGASGPVPGTPDGVWSAPGRVTLVGEHTDYNDGLALATALPHRAYVALRAREDDVVRLVSDQTDEPWTIRLSDVEPGAVRGWGTCVAGLAWALRQSGFPVRGFDAVVDSNVPIGSSLSSSAALGCAFAVALSDVFGLGLADDPDGRVVLVAAGRASANTIVGVPAGGLDQAASLLCTEGNALLLDFRPGLEAQQFARTVPFDLRSAGLGLLVVDTHGPRHLVRTQFADRRASCETAEAYLGVRSLRELRPDDLDDALTRLAPFDSFGALGQRVRHVVTETASAAELAELLHEGLGTGGRADEARAARAGALLTRSHTSLRDDYEVTSPELDLAQATCVAAGALGAEMVGGGFGGSVLALVREAEAEQVAKAVAAAFAEAGYAAPGFLMAPPSDGAGRDV